MGGRTICRQCRQPLPAQDAADIRVRVLGLVGSERCGQSSWLIRGFDQLAKETGQCRFPVEGQKQRWEDYLKALKFGRCVPATPSLPGMAWCFDYVKDGSLHRVYVYDTGGQEICDARRLIRHRNLSHLNGLIIVIDPFGLDPIRKKYGRAIQSLHPPVRPTEKPFSEPQLSVLLKSLEAHRNPPENGSWDVSVAVVITKLDVLGLFRNFGSEAGSTQAEVGLQCKKHLAEWGFENMIRALDLHFKRVSFFATYPGAFGPFSPAKPLLWMHEEAI